MFVKKFIIFPILLICGVSIGFAQKKLPPVQTVEAKSPPSVAEISAAEWKGLIDALQAENWQIVAPLAAQYLKKLSNENEKKQAAQLRYFYLYALAGKILAISSAKVPAETDSIWKELDAAVGEFVGKELVAPPRRVLSECRAVLNYVCAVKSNDRVLRVTATNKEGTMIHSFDYVTFEEKISTGEFADREIFLGGTLKRAEFNEDMSKPWVMRLFFDKGFIKSVAPTSE